MGFVGHLVTDVRIVQIALDIAVLLGVIMGMVAYAPYFERKVIGYMQQRQGPLHVGPKGLFQPIADGLKLFFKEDLVPAQADKGVFYIAPLISVFAAISALAVVPFYRGGMLSNLNIGLLFVFALSSLGAYGVVMSGWASNSKYAFLGSLRSSAQVISYEIALGLSLVGVMIESGSLNLTEIVESQAGGFWQWHFFGIQFIGMFIFIVAALAETNRTPFDLPEAESELVAGYFTEYSGFRFSLFFLAEYIGMIMMAIVGIVCFMGGWYGPFGGESVWWLVLKLVVIMFVYFWVRATVPRYRYDQLMDIGWKTMIPLALFVIVLTGTVKMYEILM